MIDVKEVLRRWSAGHGDRKIAREAGADRKTIARYTKVAIKLGLAPGVELVVDHRALRASSNSHAPNLSTGEQPS